MRRLADLWKMFAGKIPRIYLYTCWLLTGMTGTVLGFGIEWTVLLILVFGYFINIIWMMRQIK